MGHKKEDIRVGLINCDRRAFWYGAIFDEIDPLLFSEYDNAAYHHFTYYAYAELRHRKAKGFKIAKVFDEDVASAKKLSLAFNNSPKVCFSPDDVSNDVDLVFIANATGDGKNHLNFAIPGLKKGVPTFVDRPLACNTEDAMAVINTAKKYGVPLLSCSHMSMLPHAERFKARFTEVAPLTRGVIIGCGPDPTAIADGIALTLYLFGHGVEYVESMGNWPLEILHIQYNNKRPGHKFPVLVVNSHLKTDHDAVFASAYGYAGQIYGERMDSFTFTDGGLAVIYAIREMVRTGIPPISYVDMIEEIAIVEAGRQVHGKGERKYLKGKQ
ncbi:MAG: Gfo/Idh/MocA family oxidoreductase [Candidatus Omnitrophica bacterium]|nr:Gfo/Idh/MocA family oxidoreductase [Candidatus Omnitrophota bacterium]